MSKRKLKSVAPKAAAPLTQEQCFAQLATVTAMTVQEWQDFVSCTPEQQMLIVQGYKDQSWVKKADTFQAVLGVLAVLATIAGAVSGISGAVSAVAALKSL